MQNISFSSPIFKNEELARSIFGNIVDTLPVASTGNIKGMLVIDDRFAKLCEAVYVTKNGVSLYHAGNVIAERPFRHEWYQDARNNVVKQFKEFKTVIGNIPNKNEILKIVLKDFKVKAGI